MTGNLSGYFGSTTPTTIDPGTWAGNIYYITGIILPPGRKFNIRVPNEEKNNENENNLNKLNLIGFNFSVNAETYETTIIEDTTT